MRVAIIGTAGRHEDGPKLSWPIFRAMVGKAKEHVTAEDDVQSGGAAWADHVAVSLFLAGLCKSLTLYLPVQFDLECARFYTDFTIRSTQDCGAIANYYHRQFSAKLPGGRNSMLGIVEAVKRGAVLNTDYRGFHSRNTPVGQCNKLVAFTFGEGSVPKDGGTKHCWDNSTAGTKIHIPIGGLING